MNNNLPPPKGLTPAATLSEAEFQTNVLKHALREVREIEPIQVADFLARFAEEDQPNVTRLCNDMGLRWVTVRRCIKDVAELDDFWEQLVHSKVEELMMSIPDILKDIDDTKDSMTDRKAHANAIMQWAKLMNTKAYGDKGTNININIGLGDMIDKARTRVIKMKQTAANTYDPVEEADL